MKPTVLALLISLTLSGCSGLHFHDLKTPNVENSFRVPASKLEEIGYYLSIDKFKYYINEYTVAQEGKIPDSAINYLRNLDIKTIFELDLDSALLKDALNYDKLVWRIIKDQDFSKNLYEKDFVWGYNFFKNKLNEAFMLTPTKLHIALSVPAETSLELGQTNIKPQVLASEDMTLDSGHYISNRTTRAIFWDANQNKRPIEFHLGDSREFLKELKEKNGELLFEVKPFAKNYNKIYIVKYPGESSYRYAITNIGGRDRLNHLTHQISLSSLNAKDALAPVTIRGNLEEFHAKRLATHVTQLNLLPKADRVIIGQKESIDSKFNVFWKMNALNNLKAQSPQTYANKLKTMNAKDQAKLTSMLDGHNSHDVIFKEKKIVEDFFLKFEKEFAQTPSLLPIKFKQYNFDNFTIEMSDYVFMGNNGKEVRWRILSNVWGDEILPVALALKKTGHTNVTYIGTAGAFAGKGHKVGDLVSPSFIYDENKKNSMLHSPMKIDGAKYLGSVEHVGSPFEETHAWLEKAQKRSDFVEVETSYLRRVFNTKADKLEVFLLISDILGSDTETLAHATSSKRKNAQSKLLAKLFERDSLKFPKLPTQLTQNSFEKNKSMIFEVLNGKSHAYKYFAYSTLKEEKNLTRDGVLKALTDYPNFTDNYLLDRLVKAGELVHLLNKNKEKIEFEIAFSKSLVTGNWNPKSEKFNIVLKAKNNIELLVLEKMIEDNATLINSMKGFLDVSASATINSKDLIWQRSVNKIDPDYFVKIYSDAATKNIGLYRKITYNGNLTLDYLPTKASENVLNAFFQGRSPINTIKNISQGCKEAISSFLSAF